MAVLLAACAQPGSPPRPADPALQVASAVPVSPQPRILLPAAPLLGGRIARADLTGIPRPGTAGAYRVFEFPSAVAVSGTDVYIADSSRREILRFDTVQQTLTVAVPIRPNIETRLRAAADGSLYVLDPATRSVQRFARGGQRLNVYGDAANLSRPIDFVVDEVGGRVVVADATYQQFVEFHAGGQARELTLGLGGLRGVVRAMVGLTLGPTGVVISDAACGCLVEFSPVGLVTDFGHDVLEQPGALAADQYGRIYVIDAGHRSIKVFRDRRLVASLDYQALGLVGPTSLAADLTSLFVADGVAGRIAVFRILAPAKGEIQ